MKTVVLMVSKVFPAYHKKKGERTNFMISIWKDEKKHTIRKNYQYWKKRADQINEGKAFLSVRQWQDKPYRSPQKEEFRKTKIIVQSLLISGFFNTHYCFYIDGIARPDLTIDELAKNDGLTRQDFENWFTEYEAPMAIIHFTNFKY